MHRHRLPHLCTLPGERIPQPEGNAKTSDVTGARINVEEVASLQAASALYHNLLRKEIGNQEPWASEFVQNVGEPLVSLRLVPRLCFGSREPSAEQ